MTVESQIVDIARSLGAKDDAIRKWRERESVPAKWQLAIWEASGETYSPQDIERAFTSPKPKEAAE